MVSFTASFDRTTKIISAVIALSLLIPIFLLHSFLIGAIAFLVLALAYAYSARGYVVSGKALTVKRLIGNISFPLDEISEVRQATSADLDGCIKLWGSCGLFGYYGLFRTSRLGNCWSYMTDREKAVVVVAGKTTLFSPDDTEGFLAAIQAAAPASTVSAPQPSAKTGVPVMGWLVGAIAIIPLAFIIPALSYSPGIPRYTLTDRALTINDKFYPVTIQASDIDTPHLSVIDLTRDRNWQPTSRTNGFSNAHYHSGWYRTANSTKIRLYRADSKQLVLIPPKLNGVPVLLEVKNPDQFIAELRQKWK